MTQRAERRILPHMTNNKVMNIIVLVVIACIPLLYAGLMGSAYQDPVERVSNMRAAVVNEDIPYTAELASGTQEFSIGNQLEERLTNPEDGQEVGFDWESTSLENAQADLKDGTIRAYMVIPENFSQTAGTLGADDVSTLDKVKIEIVSDDSVNYLAGTMVRTVAATLQSQLSAQAADQYIDTVLVSLDTISQGMTDAADGGSQLADGSGELKDGLTTLSDAIAAASDGTEQLVDGSNSLAEGSQTLADGSTTLASGAGSLADGTSKLNAAIPSVATGATKLTSGATQVAEGSQSVTDGAKSLKAGISTYTKGAGSVADGLTSLQDSTADLVDGVSNLNAGAESLSTNLGGLASKTDTFAQKTADLAAGQASLSALSSQASQSLSALSQQCLAAGGASAFCDNLSKIAQSEDALAQKYQGLATSTGALSESATAISQGVTALEQGAQKVAGGTQSLAGSVGTVKDTAADKTVVGAINSLEQGASTLSSSSADLNSGAKSLYQGSAQVTAGAESLASGAQQLSGNLPTLTSSVGALDDGAQQLASGADSLASGASTLATGATKLATGTSSLDDGLGKISDGATSAVAGAQKLEDGSEELTSGITEGADKIPTYSESDQAKIADTASAIADVTPVRNNAVSNAAGGFLPMFLSLSLWIGAIALFLVLPALDRRHSTAEKWWMSALRPMGIAMVVGLAQATLAVLIINLTVEVDAVHVAGWVGIAVLSSLTFVAINQALIALLSYRGRLISLILLLLQITSMGGTFPIETAPKFFQWLHELLPMTWVHYAFRAMIAGGGKTGAISQAVIVLLSWMLVALIVVFVFAKLRAGKRPLAHDNANMGDMTDMVEGPFGSDPLPVDDMEDKNPIDETVDLVMGQHRS